jgi:hypothetical protein
MLPLGRKARSRFGRHFLRRKAESTGLTVVRLLGLTVVSTALFNACYPVYLYLVAVTFISPCNLDLLSIRRRPPFFRDFVDMR